MTKVKDVTLNDDVMTISLEDGTGFSLTDRYDATPVRGDDIELYTTQSGFIRGVDLNGERLFYKSDEELDDEAALRHAEYERKRRAEYDEERLDLEARFNSLPDVFQARIDRFRSHNPEFDWQYLAYELSCCTDAVLIANTLETPEAISLWWQAFTSPDDDPETPVVTGLYEGHSGNSLGFAAKLASLWVTEPAYVALEHGALAALVGCDEYGCPPPTRTEAAAWLGPAELDEFFPEKGGDE